MRLQIVDHAGRVDQTRLLRRGVDDEPRIDGDAMPAHTRPRLKDIDPRVTVGQPGQLPDIDTELFADDRQFVGEGNVDVAEAVFGELAHLRRSGVRDNALALDEAAVEGDGRFRAEEHTSELQSLMRIT